jgi:uncharacterized protein YndB with AHSA1/START domain
MTGHMERFDFREGGSYRLRLTYDHDDHAPGKSSADGDEVEVSFVRLVRDRRIEQAVTFDSEDPRFSGVMTVTWTFTPTPSGTEVSVRCENVPEGISAEDHAAGLSSSLANLAKLDISERLGIKAHAVTYNSLHRLLRDRILADEVRIL